MASPWRSDRSQTSTRSLNARSSPSALARASGSSIVRLRASASSCARCRRSRATPLRPASLRGWRSIRASSVASSTSASRASASSRPASARARRSHARSPCVRARPRARRTSARSRLSALRVSCTALPGSSACSSCSIASSLWPSAMRLRASGKALAGAEAEAAVGPRRARGPALPAGSGERDADAHGDRRGDRCRQRRKNGAMPSGLPPARWWLCAPRRIASLRRIAVLSVVIICPLSASIC